MRFRILGPLEIWTGQDWSGIGAAKWRALLAALLLNPGQVVSTERLITELWGDEPPDRAANLVSVYVLRLRRLIGDPKGQVLATRAPGYQLRLGSGDLDAQSFEALTAEGRQALAQGDASRAAAVLAEALALWRGPALADVPPSGLVTAEADRLEESRLTALELRMTADLHCGRPAELVPQLRRLISDHQLREGLWVLLMQSLDFAGRRAEAIAAFSDARQALADELGVDPGPELRQLYQRLLAADISEAPGGPGTSNGHVAGSAAARQHSPELAADSPAADSGAGAGAAASAESAGAEQAAGPAESAAAAGLAAPGRPDARAATVPAQLPADIADFTGRDSDVSQLRGLLARGAGAAAPAAVTVAVVAGTPGLGKTALAVHAAHALRRDFPDGQLYVSLRGASELPVVPEEVLARLLRDLGVNPDRIPTGLDERAALYRTELTDRRVLIVLDDAHDAAQVRSLLPGSGSCAVIVTSRHRLGELAGSRLIDLDVLGDDEARGLLTAIIGEERVAAEPGPVREVLDACAGLPLAIRIAGARLQARRGWAVRTLARRLADQRRRVDELTAGDLAVRACFDVSFDSLQQLATGSGVDAAHAFRLLGLWQGARISLPAAAALLGQPEDLVADALETLVDAHLLESPEPDWYGFHDLLRAYAAERAQLQETPEAVTDAVGRLLRWYLRTADGAASVVAPYRNRVPLGADVPPGCGLEFDTADEALAWTGRERGNLVTATRQAAAAGLHDVAWKLPVAIMACFDRHGYRAEWTATHEVALSSARTAGDRHGEAWVLNNIGMVLSQQHDEKAIRYLEEALAVRRELGDLRGQAQVKNNIAFDYQIRGMHDRAIPALSDALELQRQAGHRYGEGVALVNFAEAYVELGRYEEAIACSQEALPIVREIGSTRVEGYLLFNLGRAHLDLGHAAESAGLLEQALAIHAADGDKYGQARDLEQLGEARLQAGQRVAARRVWERAIDLLESLDADKHAAELRARLDGLGQAAGQ